MERNVMKKRLKGILALLLTFLMVYSSPLVTSAKVWDANDLKAGDILLPGDAVINSFRGTGGFAVYDESCPNSILSMQDHLRHFEDNEFLWEEGSDAFTVPSGIQWQVYKIKPVAEDNPYVWVTVSSYESHTHNYNWVTVLEPTATSDGRAEYRCDCGSVAATQTISVMYAIVDNVMTGIADAPEGGTLVIEDPVLRCLSAKMVEALLARPDLTLTIKFTDDGVDRMVTIPAGKAPTDGQAYYGYYYLGALYGWQ